MSWAGQARAADSKESPLESASGGCAGAMGSVVPSLGEREQGEVSLYWGTLFNNDKTKLLHFIK